MFNTVIFLIISLGTFALLLFAPFTRSTLWKATVTPLASIIGSGFLVSAPLLAHEFGGYAVLAMTLLIVVAILVGWAIRYNISKVEPQLKEGKDRALTSIERLSHVVLAFAYFISVTYYLSLLGHFVLAALKMDNELIAEGIAVGLLVVIGAVGWSGGAEKVAKVERYATALNLAVICGFLIALVFYSGELIAAGKSILPPPGKFDFHSLPVLLGLLIVVQGFETTRFTGDEFNPATRIKAMQMSQLISGIIYVAFFLLLSPLLGKLGEGNGIAAVITMSVVVSSILPVGLTVAAAASQFSASIADSLGDAGLVEQISNKKINPSHAYPLISAVGIAILFSIDVNGVISLASRAFALFYSLQCLVAWESARKQPGLKGKAAVFFVLAIVAALVFILGVPSGG